MVTQQILVLFFLVRVRVSQQKRETSVEASLFLLGIFLNCRYRKPSKRIAQIALSWRTRNPRYADCPFRSDKFGCARHSIQGKLDALLSLARTVRVYTNKGAIPVTLQFGTANWDILLILSQ